MNWQYFTVKTLPRHCDEMWISKVAKNTVLNHHTLSWQRPNIIFNLAVCCVSSMQLSDIIIMNWILCRSCHEQRNCRIAVLYKKERGKIVINDVIALSRDSSWLCLLVLKFFLKKFSSLILILVSSAKEPVKQSYFVQTSIWWRLLILYNLQLTVQHEQFWAVLSIKLHESLTSAKL